LLTIGVLVGLAALSKVSGVLVIPAVAAAVLLDAYRRRLPFARFIVNGLLAALPFAVLFVPWMLYGVVTFNDPFGTRTHLRPGYYFDTSLTLIQVIPLLPEVYLGYWGKLASAVYLHPDTYTVLATLPLLAIIGVVRARRPILCSRMAAEQTLVLLVLTGASAAGLLHWLQTIQFITGRLAFPAHVAFAVAITAGLRLLATRLRLDAPLRAYAVGIMIVAGLVLSGISLHTAYAPPPKLSHESLPALQGNPYDFEGTIRFLGYAQDSAILQGETYTLTLCWEVLRATERPAAFSIKIVRDGAIIADRTSVHGLGRYFSPLWQPGDRFCDAVDVPIQTPPQPGQTYDLLLVLLDARTQAVDWTATAMDGTPVQFPFIGQVHAP
jgi:hypothetical protein